MFDNHHAFNTMSADAREIMRNAAAYRRTLVYKARVAFRDHCEFPADCLLAYEARDAAQALRTFDAYMLPYDIQQITRL